MVSSSVYPDLERKPGGPDNWVEATGGLPKYIERIAKHLHYEQGMSISRSIAVAVNTVKRWAKGGTVTSRGTTKRITAKTQAQAAAAVASWEAKKKLAKTVNLAEPQVDATSTMVALMLPESVLQQVAVPGGTPPEDLHITLTFNGDVEDDDTYETLVALVRKCAADYGSKLSGTIGGIGAFPPGDQGTPWLALVDVPGLTGFQYHLCEALRGSDAPASETHGYTPHVTRSYNDQPDPLPAIPVSFESVWVVRGNDQRTEIPLGGGDSTAGAGEPNYAKLPSTVGARKEAKVELSAMLERARAIHDPAQKARVRAAILDLAGVSTEFRKKAKAANQTIPGTDSFPIPNVEYLKKAIRAYGRAKNPAAAKKHIIARARALGATKLLPSSWKVDLANAIVADLTIDLALTKDGRKSFKNQGKWAHGFVPKDDAAVQSKAKGSPIAEKRVRRLFGSASGLQMQSKPPAPTNNQPSKPVKGSKPVALKGEAGGSSIGTSPGRVGNPLLKDATATQRVNPKIKKEVSRGRANSSTALKPWDGIPDNLKTIRNGKRYVVVNFAGKQQLTEWVGPSAGSQVKADPADGLYSSLSMADAAKFNTGQLRRLLSVPGQPDNVKKVLNAALTAASRKAPGRRTAGVGVG